MSQAIESIALWSEIIGEVAAVYNLIESQEVKTLLGLIFFSTSILLTFRIFNLKKYIKTTNTVIGDKKIDALNVANIVKKVNTSLKVQEAAHLIKVHGKNLFLTFEYSGYCKAKEGESGFVYSIDSDVHIPFEKLTCYGVDLLNDPREKHKIYPLLLGPDGLTKRVGLPFASRLSEGDPFNVVLYCKLPGCMKLGKDYITTTLAFDDDKGINKFSVKIEFVGRNPKWVRLYDATSGKPRLVKDLKPARTKARSVFYEENYQNIESQKALVYLFER